MNETFGGRFARLRRAKGLTQEEIASRVNISAQAVSKWENDLSSPDISILVSLADILDVSLDELLGRQIERVELVAKSERRDAGLMMLKVIVDTKDGDRVRINLPVALIKTLVAGGVEVDQMIGNDALRGIDFNQILALIDQGLIGKLVEVVSADGDHVSILVE